MSWYKSNKKKQSHGTNQINKKQSHGTNQIKKTFSWQKSKKQKNKLTVQIKYNTKESHGINQINKKKQPHGTSQINKTQSHGINRMKNQPHCRNQASKKTIP